MKIRIPLASNAWKKYGKHWVQLDAPRYFYIHTLRSFEWLIKSASFKIQSVHFDSSEFQFWGSEQYVKGISLMSDISYLNNPENSIFDKAEISTWSNKATELNKNSLGDQATFILKHEMN